MRSSMLRIEVSCIDHDLIVPPELLEECPHGGKVPFGAGDLADAASRVDCVEPSLLPLVERQSEIRAAVFAIDQHRSRSGGQSLLYADGVRRSHRHVIE